MVAGESFILKMHFWLEGETSLEMEIFFVFTSFFAFTSFIINSNHNDKTKNWVLSDFRVIQILVAILRILMSIQFNLRIRLIRRGTVLSSKVALNPSYWTECHR